MFEKGGKWFVKDKFRVEKIAYDEKKRISGLSIVNQNNDRVYIYYIK